MFLFLCLKFEQLSRGVCGVRFQSLVGLAYRSLFAFIHADKCSSNASGGVEVRVFYVPDHASEGTKTNTTFQIILADLWDDTADVYAF